jgi:hypothetical protein
MTDRAAQSFRRTEIDAMAALFRTLRRGGDVTAILRSADVCSVEGKFSRMSHAAKPDQERPNRLHRIRDLRKGWDDAV